MSAKAKGMKLSKLGPSRMPSAKASRKFRWNETAPYMIWDPQKMKHVSNNKTDKQIIGDILDPDFMRAVSRILIELMENAES